MAIWQNPCITSTISRGRWGAFHVSLSYWPPPPYIFLAADCPRQALLKRYFRSTKFTSFQRQLTNVSLAVDTTVCCSNAALQFGFRIAVGEGPPKVRVYVNKNLLGKPAEALLTLRREGCDATHLSPVRLACRTIIRLTRRVTGVRPVKLNAVCATTCGWDEV